eukprot:scaffold648818_cov32-Prasinocladus_malaysianus.AAC.1
MSTRSRPKRVAGEKWYSTAADTCSVCQVTPRCMVSALRMHSTKRMMAEGGSRDDAAQPKPPYGWISAGI